MNLFLFTILKYSRTTSSDWLLVPVEKNLHVINTKTKSPLWWHAGA
jgi:hypothetical protein